MQKGKSSIKFEQPPVITSAASVVGKKEGEGPLGQNFDVVEQDPMFGKDTWEKAESAMQKHAAELALEKGKIEKQDIRYLFAGDLLGQLIATSFGTVDLEIPLFGLFGACSTMGEALSLGAMTVAAGYADRVLAQASSHYATAEKQFRFPLGYGNQRPLSASWTVTGCGAAVIENRDIFLEYKNVGVEKEKNGRADKEEVREQTNKESLAQITGITTGRMIDMEFHDSTNMGAAMAPAACDTILQNFRDFRIDESYYDQIVTGDLGKIGSEILYDFMKKEGHDIEEKHVDCGNLIFDPEEQDTHAGGSGCGCTASVLCGYILPRIQQGIWNRVLYVPTGALLSTMSYNEGENIPGIAHGVMLENMESYTRK